jgi:hypothetical protein
MSDVTIPEDLAENYRALHAEGESWEAIAGRQLDESGLVAAWCRAQAAGDDSASKAPSKRRSKADAETTES